MFLPFLKWFSRRDAAGEGVQRAYEDALLAGWVPPTLAQPAPPARSHVDRLPETAAESVVEAFLARVYAAQQA